MPTYTTFIQHSVGFTLQSYVRLENTDIPSDSDKWLGKILWMTHDPIQYMLQREAGHLSVLEIKKYTENIWNIRTGFKNNKNYSVYHLLLTEVLGCPVTKNPDWYLRYHLLPTYKWHYLFLNLSFNYPQTS